MWAIIFGALRIVGLTVHLAESAPHQEAEVSPLEQLRLGYDSRRAWCTSEVEWAVTSYGSEGATHYFSTVDAGNDTLWVCRGDITGCQYADGGENSKFAGGTLHRYSERRTLRKDGKQYSYTEDALSGSITDASGDKRRDTVAEIHLLGYWPSPSRMESWEQLGLDTLGSFESTSGDQDTLVVQAAGTNQVVYEWSLDPAYGYQPTRCCYLKDGEARLECRVTYGNFEGRHYPQRADYFKSGALVQTITVLSASFDDPSHAQKLSPAVLGIPVGASVGVGGIALVWDGEKPVSAGEAIARKQAGELDYSEFERLYKDHKQGLSQGRTPKTPIEWSATWLVMAQDPGLWEEFTRRFIRVFLLDAEQVEKAWVVHGKYRKEALDHLNANRREIQELRSNIRALEADPSSKGAPERLAQLREQEARLIQPVQRVFDEKLKPQLVKLLTPEQRTRAIEQESKNPGSLHIRELLESADHARAIEAAQSAERAR